MFTHLRTISQIPELPLQIVASFLEWNDGHAVFERLYLLLVLLARESVFCKFTHWYNNTSGEISDLEGVIDRIISFVIGIRRDV